MKGILFTPAMALAACDGRKTVTRRVVTPKHDDGVVCGLNPDGIPIESWGGGAWHNAARSEVMTPTYVAGERRCLLTTWAVYPGYDDRKPSELPPNFDDRLEGRINAPDRIWHAGLGTKHDWCGKSRPGRFLPNSLRPLMPMFDVVSVCAERVQEITEADAKAEGAHRKIWITSPMSAGAMGATGERGTFRDGFKDLWDSINAERGFGWSVNPWVWRIEFRRVAP